VSQFFEAILCGALGCAPVRDVANQAGEHALVVDLELGNRKVDGKYIAIFSSRFNFAANAHDVCLAGHQVTLQKTIVLLAVWRGHQHADITAEHFLRAVAKYPLGRRIDGFDDAVLVDGDDGIDGHIEQRTKARLGIMRVLSRRMQVLGSDCGQSSHQLNDCDS